jgi:hypothetical protein
MKNKPDNQKPASLNPAQVTQVLIYEHAQKLLDRLNKRIEQANEHVKLHQANGVLGALDGADEVFQVLRVLLIFDRDHVNPKTK